MKKPPALCYSMPAVGEDGRGPAPQAVETGMRITPTLRRIAALAAILAAFAGSPSPRAERIAVAAGKSLELTVRARNNELVTIVLRNQFFRLDPKKPGQRPTERTLLENVPENFLGSSTMFFDYECKDGLPQNYIANAWSESQLMRAPLYVLDQIAGQGVEKGRMIETKGGVGYNGTYTGKFMLESVKKIDGVPCACLRGEFEVTGAKDQAFTLQDTMQGRRTVNVRWDAVFDLQAMMLTSIHTELFSDYEEAKVPKPDNQVWRPNQMTRRVPPDWCKPGSMLIDSTLTITSKPIVATPQAEIDKAIVRGVNYLRERFENEAVDARSDTYGSQVGAKALAALALLKCGTPPDYEPILKTIELVMPKSTSTGAANPYAIAYDTYTPGLALMLGETWLERIGELPEETRKTLLPVERKAREGMETVLEALIRKYYDLPYWGQPDLSNAQYGILGLHAACGAGIFTRETHKDFDKIWTDILDMLLTFQLKKGDAVDLACPYEYGRAASADDASYVPVKAQARGWTYSLNPKNNNGSGMGTRSMSATGTASTGIALQYLMLNESLGRAEKAALLRKAVPAINDGLAWLQANYSVTGNVGSYDGWHLYYLYALERVGVLLDVPKLGKHDWYNEGAIVLLNTQMSNGRWANGRVDTAFALLFLKRATLKVAVSPLDD